MLILCIVSFVFVLVIMIINHTNCNNNTFTNNENAIPIITNNIDNTPFINLTDKIIIKVYDKYYFTLLQNKKII